MRCEALKHEPFAMGGTMHQCKNDATIKVTQLSDSDTMDLCDSCIVVFKKYNEGEHHLYKFEPISTQ